jgi:hypothetical protein
MKTLAETRLLSPLTLTCIKLLNWNLTLHQLSTKQYEYLRMNYMLNNPMVHNHIKSHTYNGCWNYQQTSHMRL